MQPRARLSTCLMAILVGATFGALMGLGVSTALYLLWDSPTEAAGEAVAVFVLLVAAHALAGAFYGVAACRESRSKQGTQPVRSDNSPPH